MPHGGPGVARARLSPSTGGEGGTSGSSGERLESGGAKVILLVGHPDSKLENDRLHQLAKMSFDGAPPDLKWLTDGSGPPEHLSVFVHRTDLATQETEYDLVVPAQVHFPGGATEHCHMLTIATPGLRHARLAPGNQDPPSHGQAARGLGVAALSAQVREPRAG